MDVAASSQSSRVVAAAINFPLLTKMDPSFIQTFLRHYDQSTHKITTHAQQLFATAMITTDVACPIKLKYPVVSS